MAEPKETKPKTKLVENEERILEFWKKNEIFKKTLEKPSPRGEFVFFEGPPTANGRPGIHHIEARAFKDAIPRYKTMRGFHVRRKGGWDTHGLPVELEVEKAHGFKSKKDIEAYGIAKFNRECKENVWKYVDEWEKFTERIGYWVDEEHPYITYKSRYIESLWNIVAKVYDKGLIYKDYRVVPWCPRCGTALSSHELAQGYANVKDLSVYIKFKIIGREKTYFLAWTTTPWTLPGNVALAVGNEITYVECTLEETGETFILAESRLSVMGDVKYIVTKTFSGKELVAANYAYEPLYPYLKDNLAESEKPKLKNAFRVYPADFVTTEDGTGIVHTAVMYGADDFALGTKVGLPKHHLVSDGGVFFDYTGFLSGRFVKDEGTAVEIIKDLAHRNLLFKKEKYEHSYPHCWRCKTPLIYFARDSWYIRMSDLRDKLIKENEKINWEPAHIKEGRFGEWLRDIKDWAISRERYWGTPLPIWQTDDGSERLVVDSLETLKQRIIKSGNSYMLLRHGEAESNVKGISNSVNLDEFHLTEKGMADVAAQAKKLADWGVDVIVSSDFLRTKETAHIVAERLGIDRNEIVFDKRLREFRVGPEREGRHWRETESMVRNGHAFAGMETPDEIKKRAFAALYDIDAKYKDKKILIVSHGAILNSLLFGIESQPTIDKIFHDSRRHFQHPSEMHELHFAPLPHNDEYELDLHKPYIDDVILLSDSGKPMRRVKEVMDVWFDSGAMPYAQDHYPFNEKFKGFFGKRKLSYPADFISEAIDQTRGWFYTLHAVGILMGRGRAYKNVICLGHILDKEGKKMSKSLGNIVNPWDMIEKYGADAVRYFMYSVNQPGDSKNFDEKTVDEIVKRVFNLITNIHSFYELYAEKNSPRRQPQPENVLDIWILSRLSELTKLMTEKLDSFKLFEPTRAVRDFVDDFSTWYVRRSRDRFKSDDRADKAAALATTRHVLFTLSELLAPFAPFYAEWLYEKVRDNRDPISVHLTDWPEAGEIREEVLAEMKETREIASLGLESRMKAKINVRQPLSAVTVYGRPLLEHDEEMKKIIRDELNVKDVRFAPAETEVQKGVVAVDATLTPELKKEGVIRDLIRAIQDLRKTEGLSVSDKVSLLLDSDEKGKELVRAFVHDIKKITLVTNIEHAHVPGAQELVFEEYRFRIGFRR